MNSVGQIRKDVESHAEEVRFNVVETWNQRSFLKRGGVAFKEV